jgi:hypothetical protein
VEELDVHWDDGCFIIADPFLVQGRPFPSAFRWFEIPRTDDDATFVCDGTLTITQIAGLPTVYGDDRWWPVLVIVNGLAPFIAVFTRLGLGTELRVPPLSLVKQIITAQLGAK